MGTTTLAGNVSGGGLHKRIRKKALTFIFIQLLVSSFFFCCGSCDRAKAKRKELWRWRHHIAHGGDEGVSLSQDQPTDAIDFVVRLSAAWIPRLPSGAMRLAGSV
jgi:hypothetical protein